jgi:hypothetical protein
VKNTRGILALVSAVTILAWAPGCSSSKSSTPAKDEVEVVPFASTIMLSEADLARLTPETGDGKLVFPDAPASLASVATGQIIVAGKSAATPKGLLRIVKSAARDGTSLTLETLHAPLQLAFRKVHIKSALHGTGELGKLPWPGSDETLAYDPFSHHVGASQPVHAIVFDGDGDQTTTNDQVAVDGELAAAVDFTFRLDFDWGALQDLPSFVEDCITNLLEAKSCSLLDLLPEAKADFDVTPSLASSLQLHGAAILEFDKEIVLFNQNLGELVFGPIVVTPNAQVMAHVEGAASAAFEASVDAAIDFEASVTLSSKHPSTPDYQPPRLKDVKLDARPPKVTLKASAQAGLGVELSLLIYGVTGPFASARAYGRVDADVFRQPCVQLHAGLEGSLGAKITTPALLFLDPITLFDWRADFDPVDQLLDVPVPGCEPPPNASMLPPGAGPDANHLAMPAFEPWSRSWPSLMDSGGAIGGGTTYWLDQQKSIDGRFVVAARHAAALVKIDQDGALTWGRQLFSAPDDPFAILHPVRTVPAADASMWVLAEPRLPPLSVLKVNQSGHVVLRREIDVPDPMGCGLAPVGLARDDSAGLYVVASCTASRKIHVVHLDGSGAVVGARSFADQGGAAIDPMVVTRAGRDLFISGRLRPSADEMFAVRFDASGAVSFANRYTACQAGPDVYPVRGLVEANGDVTVAGRGGAEHNGFIARLKVDGSVGFAAFPGFGFGAGSVFTLDSIAELPTTGYVASGSTARFTRPDPEGTMSVALLQLDAVGRPMWAKRYTLQGAAGQYLLAGQTDLQLTDDGGIIVTGIVQHDPPGVDADLWGMKVFAKDGNIAFTSGKAVVTAIDALPDDAVVALPCSLDAAPWSVTVSDEPAVTTRAAETAVIPWASPAAMQTP